MKHIANIFGAFLGGVIGMLAMIVAFHSIKKSLFTATHQHTEMGADQQNTQLYSVQVCNGSSHEKVFISLAYFDPGIEKWSTKGWFASLKDSCSIPIQHVQGPVFGYAESQDGQHEWSFSPTLQKNNQPTNTHSRPSSTFCVHENLRFDFNDSDCKKDHLAQNVTQKKFQRLHLIGTGGIFTWDLVD